MERVNDRAGCPVWEAPFTAEMEPSEGSTINFSPDVMEKMQKRREEEGGEPESSSSSAREDDDFV